MAAPASSGPARLQLDAAGRPRRWTVAEARTVVQAWDELGCAQVD